MCTLNFIEKCHEFESTLHTQAGMEGNSLRIFSDLNLETKIVSLEVTVRSI